MRMPAETRIEEIELGSHQRCHIMCTILTLGKVPIEFLVGFGRMQMPINGQVFQHIIKGMEVGKGRDMAAQHIMAMSKEQRPRWLFFLGDDMIPPWDGFVRLYEEAEANKWDCLTGLYYWKGEPPTPLTWRHDTVGRLLPGKHFKVGEVIWVDLTGLDFTLIRVELLERFAEKYPGQPFFKTGPSLRKGMPESIRQYALPESVVTHTEDVWFYGKVKELGGRIGVHTGVRVAHLDVHTGMIY